MEKRIEQKIIDQARLQSAFRCCVCKSTSNSIYLINPNKTIDINNVVCLCDDCKNLFYGNQKKFKKLKMLRDQWWMITNLSKENDVNKSFIEVNSELRSYYILMECCIHLNIVEIDHYDSIKYGLVSKILKMQKTHPNMLRGIVIEIEGHSKGNVYDEGIRNILFDFIPNELMKYITEVHTSEYSYINPHSQINKIPSIEKWKIC